MNSINVSKLLAITCIKHIFFCEVLAQALCELTDEKGHFLSAIFFQFIEVKVVPKHYEKINQLKVFNGIHR